MQNRGVQLYTQQDCLLFLVQVPSVASNCNGLIKQCDNPDVLYRIIKRLSESNNLNAVSFKSAIEFINFLHPNNEDKIDDTVKATILFKEARLQFSGQIQSDDFLSFKNRLPEISLSETFTLYYLPLFKLGLLGEVDEIFERRDAADLITALRLLDENDLATDERVNRYLQLEVENETNLRLSDQAGLLITRTKFRLEKEAATAVAVPPVLLPAFELIAPELIYADAALSIPTLDQTMAELPAISYLVPVVALAPEPALVDAALEMNLLDQVFLDSQKKLIAAGIWSDEIESSIRLKPGNAEFFLKLKENNIFMPDAIKYANRFDVDHVDLFIEDLTGIEMLSLPNLLLCLSSGFQAKAKHFSSKNVSLINQILTEIIVFNKLGKVELNKLTTSPYEFIINNRLHKPINRKALCDLESSGLLEFQPIVTGQVYDVKGLVETLTSLPEDLRTVTIRAAIVNFGLKSKAKGIKALVNEILQLYSRGLTVSIIEQQHLSGLTQSCIRKDVKKYADAVLGLFAGKDLITDNLFDPRALEFSLALRENYKKESIPNEIVNTFYLHERRPVILNFLRHHFWKKVFCILLTVDNIQSLINTNFILAGRGFKHLFDSKEYAPELITQNVFTLLIGACANTPDDPLQLALDLQEIINMQILIPMRAARRAREQVDEQRAALYRAAIRARENPQQIMAETVLNDNQSTHTESVHASISETAGKLKKLYIKEMSEVNLIKCHKIIYEWITGLENTFRNTAAINGYNQCSLIKHTDRVSAVSIRQLIVLFWVGIHDENNRIGTLDDAKKFFITAFYEIRRGYNISEAGVDNGSSPDRPICTSGTFNKFINQLQGIHKLVVVRVIKQSMANLKFTSLIKNAAIEFFKACDTSASSSSGVTKKDRVYDAIMKDEAGIEAIWDEIKKDVIKEFYDEFSSLYPGGIDGKKFQDYIIHYTCVDITELPIFVEYGEARKRGASSLAASTYSMKKDEDSESKSVSPCGAAETNLSRKRKTDNELESEGKHARYFGLQAQLASASVASESNHSCMADSTNETIVATAAASSASSKSKNSKIFMAASSNGSAAAAAASSIPSYKFSKDTHSYALAEDELDDYYADDSALAGDIWWEDEPENKQNLDNNSIAASAASASSSSRGAAASSSCRSRFFKSSSQPNDYNLALALKLSFEASQGAVKMEDAGLGSSAVAAESVIAQPVLALTVLSPATPMDLDNDEPPMKKAPRLV